MSKSTPKILFSKHDAHSSTSGSSGQTPNITPSKRKSPRSSHQDPFRSEPSNKPSPSHTQSEPLLMFTQPKTPYSPPLSSSKKSRSASLSVAKNRDQSSDDEATPSRNAQKRQKNFSSPCGKLYSHQGVYLERHKLDCKECIAKEGQGVEDHHDSGSDLTRETSVDSTDKRAFQAVGDGLRENCDTVSEEVNHKPAATHKLASELRGSGHEQGAGRAKADADVDEDSSSAGSPSVAEKKVSAGSEATRRASVQATKGGDNTLGLEDDTDPEGEDTDMPAGTRMNGLQVHDKIKHKLGRTLTPKDQKGYIYILSDPKRPHLCKIGRSTRTEDRRKAIQYTCGLELKPVQSQSLHVQNYVRTEVLIHAYLADLRRPYDCKTCGRKHGEWFEISQLSAQTHVLKWVKFMNQQGPYDADSKQLNAFWTDLVTRRGQLFDSLDVEKIRSDWAGLLSPTTMDRLGYRFDTIWPVVWAFFWPINAMVAWTIAFVAIQHPVTFALMTASVVGTFVSMTQDIHRLRHEKTVSTKSRRKK